MAGATLYDSDDGRWAVCGGALAMCTLSIWGHGML